MQSSYCWGVFREVAHSPGRESDDTEILRLTGKHLEARGNGLASLEISTPSLEDVFLELTGRRLRD